MGAIHGILGKLRLEDVQRGINATHILQEFILMGVLVGKGYSPKKYMRQWKNGNEQGDLNIYIKAKICRKTVRIMDID